MEWLEPLKEKENKNIFQIILEKSIAISIYSPQLTIALQ